MTPASFEAAVRSDLRDRVLGRITAAFLAILRPSWADRHKYPMVQDQARACCDLADEHAARALAARDGQPAGDVS
jgi:hypothetical protein